MTDPARVHALVFGLERYDYGSAMDLPGSARDAVRFARWVRDNGVPPQQVWMGLSRLDEQEPESAPPDGVRTVGTTRGAVRGAFTEELPKHEGELLLVFWSGHGMVTTDRERVLFTSDATPASRLNIGVENLLTHLASVTVRFSRVIVLIDGCASYAWTQGLGGKLPTETWDMADERAGQQTQDVLLAAAQGQTAAPNRTERYGQFAKALLDTLAPPNEKPMGLPPDLDAVWVAVQAAMASLRASGQTRQTPLRFERQQNREVTASARTGDRGEPSRLGQGSPAEHSIARLMDDYGVFVGRETQLGELNRFLNDDTRRQLLIWEPTGRGKTALLIRWVQMLQHRDDLTVLFLAISHRAKTDTIEMALPHLAVGLADVHREQLSPQDLASPDTLRLVVQQLLARSPGGQLVVVIDGLDETTGWEVDQRLFPAQLPGRVKVVAAAKATAATTREQLLHQLGWQHAATANISPLEGLTDRDIVNVLATPKLASTPSALDRLVRGVAHISQRDPLAVRMISDDLAAGNITLDDLHTLPSGLAAYFEHSLKDIQERSANSDAIAAVMGLCATAYGPLTAEDLAALDPDLLGGGAVQATAIDEVNRYLYGNRTHGYTLQHPYLRQLYLDRLLDHERARLRDRFVIWGTDRLAAGIESMPGYLVRFWITHLAGTGRWTTINKVCLDPDPRTPGGRPRWAAVQHLASGNYAGYTADLGILLDHARDGQDLATAFGCALALAAVHSTAAGLPAALPALLVEHGTTRGRWSMTTAIVHANSIPDESRRADALIHLAPLADQAITRQLLIAATSVDDPAAKAKALAALAPYLDAGQLREALSATASIDAPWAKAEVLAGLAPHLDPGPLREAAAAAISIEHPAAKAQALAEMVPHLDDPRLALDEALTAADTVDDPRWKAQALAALAPHLDADQLGEALSAVNSIDDPRWKAQALDALAALAPHLDADQLGEALAAAVSIDDSGWKAQALFAVAPETAAATIHVPAWKAQALAALAPHLDAGQLREALSAAANIDDPWAKAQALTALAPHLDDPRPVLDEALGAAATIDDPMLKAQALAALAPHLDDPRPVLDEALGAAATIDDPVWKAQALARLAPYLDADQLREALTAAANIDDAEAKAQALTALAPHLDDPRPVLDEALTAAASIDDPRWKVQALAALAPHLDDPRPALDEALKIATTIDDPWAKAEVLTALAPHLDADQLREALTAAANIDDLRWRAKALTALTPHLDADQLREALTAAANIDDPGWKAQALTALAPHLDNPRPVLDEALRVTARINDPWWKAQALAALAPHLDNPRPAVDEALRVTATIDYPGWKAQALTALAPHLDADQLREALTAAANIDNLRWKAEALTALATHLDADQLREALTAATNIDDPWWKAQALTALAPHLDDPRPVLDEALTAATNIDDPWWKAQALTALAPHLDYPRPAVDEALRVTATIDYPGWKAQALTALAPHLDADQLREALTAAANIEAPGWKAQVLAALAPHLDDPDAALHLMVATTLINAIRLRASGFSAEPGLDVIGLLLPFVDGSDVIQILSIAATGGNELIWEVMAQSADWLAAYAPTPDIKTISDALVELAACTWST
jgi:hypothetical protein